MERGRERNRFWTKAETMELIQEYHVLRHLWDPSNEWFKNRRKRYQALHNLGLCFKTSAAEVKRKLHNLRSQLFQELKKLKAKIDQSEPGEESSHTSSWPYFDLMCTTVTDLEKRKYYRIWKMVSLVQGKATEIPLFS
ncbi:uncharacterized protein [Hetaerina americana]|uniref:uncharacterized protein n=1 Tax=Hetaerina americana TaxID=62018 RepID=UPI003A7F3C52